MEVFVIIEEVGRLEIGLEGLDLSFPLSRYDLASLLPSPSSSESDNSNSEGRYLSDILVEILVSLPISVSSFSESDE